jgi:hypothetical protein
VALPPHSSTYRYLVTVAVAFVVVVLRTNYLQHTLSLSVSVCLSRCVITMSKPTLTFFQFSGRGEPIRLAFFIGGVDFEDKRIDMPDWPALKPTTPFGTLPNLEFDGAMYGQSNAQLRYVGKLTSLYPTDAVDGMALDTRQQQ